ncbi:hypothetical protein [Mycobacterium kyogaense]|uniref:hypothetical protein n=1 Tax=Mycobacterium kyogaense TaxID=2212479 RepID=UPI0013C4A0F2|nr:hypothetical protein [Mycobacterium kyogaense]
MIAIQNREWAAATKDLSERDIEADARELRSQGWVDFDSGQLWVRPFMKLDGVMRSPSGYVSAARAVKTVRSRQLRQSVWTMFETFPKPVAPVPYDADDSKKVKRAQGLNEAVERAFAELQQSISTPGVRESLIPHGMGHPVPHRMGSVGVDADDDVGGGSSSPTNGRQNQAKSTKTSFDSSGEGCSHCGSLDHDSWGPGCAASIDKMGCNA